MANTLAQQPGCGQHRHEEAHAFDDPGGQQRVHAWGHCTEGTPQGQQPQTRQHHPPGPQPIGKHTHQQAKRHAGQLDQRQKKPRLQQTQAQGAAQQRNGHRQLAHMQGTADPDGDHQSGQTNGLVGVHRCRGVVQSDQVQGNKVAPLRRWCSRMANRSVIPAM